jgi:hypothetical protein
LDWGEEEGVGGGFFGVLRVVRGFGWKIGF